MFIYKIGLCTVILVFISCGSLPDISRTNNKDLGPWLTISGDPARSIDISWLSEEMSETKILFGSDPENLREYGNDRQREKLHTLSINGLQPDTEYFYILNEQIFNFQTASTNNNDYKISIIGDMQPFKKQSRISNEIMTRALVREDPHLIAQVGDVSESGGMNFLQTETLKNISEYASHIPFAAAAGNHDYYTKGKDNFRKLFPYEYPSDTELYHSLDYQNASLFFLDVHVENRTVSQDQKTWFEKSLMEAASSGDRWIFVFVHDEILSSGSTSMNFGLQKWLVPLADRYDVDAVFFGHSHMYEHWQYQYGQSGLIYDNDALPTGNSVHYFCTGGGGGYMKVESLIEGSDQVVPSYWEELTGSESFKLKALVKKWNPLKFIDYTDNPINGAPDERKNYYQVPEVESYSGYNSIYGYNYGEKTLHYINLNISGDDNEVCTISVHYPDGSLLKGPDGKYPQEWVLYK